MSRSFRSVSTSVAYLAALGAVSSLLLSCGADEIVDPPRVTVSSIEVSVQADTLSALGETTQCTATVRDASGTTITGMVVIWSAGDSTILNVSASGLVTAVSNGLSTITAELEGVRGQGTIVVRQEIVRLAVEPGLDTLTAFGEQLQLVANAQDSRGNAVADAVVEWSTDDTTVVALSDSGLVIADTNGTATVRAEVGGMEAYAELVVDQRVAAVIVQPSTDSLLALGEAVQLSATPQDSAGNEVYGASVTWSTDDTLVVGLTDLGLATALVNGNALVSAEAESVVGQALIVVWQEVTDMNISTPLDTLVSLGEDVQVAVEAWDSGGSVVASPQIEWTTSDGSVISVSESGLVSSVGNGVAEDEAESGRAQAEKTLVVDQVAVRIGIIPSADTIVQTGWVDLQAVFYDANDHTMDSEQVTWESTVETSATVAADGRVEGLSPGTSTVTATWDVLSGDADITVAAPTVTLLPELPSLFAADTMWLDGTVLAPNGDRVNHGPLSWESANPGVATVSDAVVDGVSPGLARISVGLAGVWDTVEVAVLEQSSRIDREIGYFRDIYIPGEGTSPELRTMSIDGSNNTRLSAEGEYVSDYAWSRSGTRIAVNYVALNGTGRSGTYISDHDGANETDIGVFAWTPHWSPDDTWITYRNYVASGESDVYFMAPGGSGQTRLTTATGDELEPRWSPDGRRILFLRTVAWTTTSELWVMNSDGTNARHVVTPTPVYRARWSPDGKYIAYDSWLSQTPSGRYRGGIWVIDAFGDTRPLTDNCGQDGTCSGPDYARPDWSPDGASLTFRSETGVFVVNVDGSSMTRVVAADGLGAIAAWSPSGEYIVYTDRNQEGWPAIAIARPDGTGVSFLTGEENAGLPRWR